MTSGRGTTCWRSSGRGSSPIFEGWTALAGLAPVTSRVRLGLMVGANTFRNPGLTAKLATTLDHVSGGRAVLGIGGAWFEREHDAFGIEFGASPGWRLDRFDEAVGLLRRLLDGERIAHHDGPAYPMDDALVAPRPVQAHLPILDRRVRAEEDAAHDRQVRRRSGTRAAGSRRSAGRSASCEEHCAAVGRDPSTIERTDQLSHRHPRRAADAEARFAELLAHNASPDAGNVPNLLGSPEQIADELRPFRDELGFRPRHRPPPRPVRPRDHRAHGRGPSSCWDRADGRRLGRRCAAGGRARRRGRRRQARPWSRRVRRGPADGRGQHRRRHGAPWAPRHARPRHRDVHARRDREPGMGLGDRGRDLQRRRVPRALRPGDVVPAR